MRDTLLLVTQTLAFVIAMSTLIVFRRATLRRAVEAYIAGTVASCIAVLVMTSSPAQMRIGMEIGVNADLFGYAAALSIVLLTSGSFFGSWLARLLQSGVLLVVLFLSQGRTALFACVLSLLLLFWLQRKYVLVTLFALAMSVAGLFVIKAAIAGTDNPYFRRYASIAVEPWEAASAQRAMIWRYLLGKIPKVWPIGIGLGQIPIVSVRDGVTVGGLGLQSHNMYLTLVIEMGVVALLSIVAWQFIFVWRAAAAMRDRPIALPVFIFISLQGFFSGFGFGLLDALLLVAAWSMSTSAKRSRTVAPIRERCGHRSFRVEQFA